MNNNEKRRWKLLLLLAHADEEYERLMRQAKKAELVLEELEQELTEEQIDAIWSVISAYEEADRYLSVLACKQMLFRSEIK